MIETQLRDKGITDLRLERRLSPPWTSDWVTEAARDKLRAYGIAPPVDGTASDGLMAGRAARALGPVEPGDRLPALRLVPHRAGQPVRLDPLQGQLPLPRLPRAFRLLQVPLSHFDAPAGHPLATSLSRQEEV